MMKNIQSSGSKISITAVIIAVVVIFYACLFVCKAFTNTKTVAVNESDSSTAKIKSSEQKKISESDVIFDFQGETINLRNLSPRLYSNPLIEEFCISSFTNKYSNGGSLNSYRIIMDLNQYRTCSDEQQIERLYLQSPDHKEFYELGQKLFVQICKSIPNQKIVESMKQYYNSGKVVVRFYAINRNNPIGTLATTSTQIYPDGEIIIIMNLMIDYLIDPLYSDLWLSLMIYHEFIHMNDAITGEHVPIPISLREKTQVTKEYVSSLIRTEVKAWKMTADIYGSCYFTKWENTLNGFGSKTQAELTDKEVLLDYLTENYAPQPQFREFFTRAEFRDIAEKHYQDLFK